MHSHAVFPAQGKRRDRCDRRTSDEARIGYTGEIVLTSAEKAIARKFDDVSGIEVWNLSRWECGEYDRFRKKQKSAGSFSFCRLLNENAKYRSMAIPESDVEQKLPPRALRTCATDACGHRFLQVQDEYLAQTALDKGIVGSTICSRCSWTYFWRGDITWLAADAIVKCRQQQVMTGSLCAEPHLYRQLHPHFAGVQLHGPPCAGQMRTIGYEEPPDRLKSHRASTFPHAMC